MNPFRFKATKARALADRLNGKTTTAHDAAMAASFPLGPGFGHGSARSRAKRIDASITRAVKATEAERRARFLESQAHAFDLGLINSQGRARSAASDARSAKREAAKAKREEKIAAARAEVESKPRHEVSPEVWATAHGYLGGSARKLVMSEHAEYIATASRVAP